MALRSPLYLLAALLAAFALARADVRASKAPVLGISAPVRLSDPAPALTPDAGENFNELTAAAGQAFFTAYLPATGTELWVTDGTPLQGTHLVKDIVPGRNSSYPHQLRAIGDKLLFIANQRLWASDGTAAGTQLVSDLAPGAAGSAPDSFARLGGQVLFRAADGRGNVSLWAVRAQPFQQLVPLVRH